MKRINCKFTELMPRFLAGLILLFAVIPVNAQRRKPALPAAQSQAFETAAAQAKEAREAGSLEEAITYYQKAVALKPRWDEGWWYLATLLYDRDRYEEATKAFKQVAALSPKVGAPLVMLGLCEYRIGRYDEAFIHLQQGKQRGIGDNKELSRVMHYHEATLFVLRSDFETGQRAFTALAREGLNSQDLIMGMGLAILRRAALPKQIDINSPVRELIRRAGQAQVYFAQMNVADARTEYERLISEYPKEPNLHYAYGRFLVDIRDDEAGVAAFYQEIENSPQHALARLQIAYIKSRSKDSAAGIPLAEEAVKANPRLPLGHYILGRLYFETGQNPRAIEELEIAKKMAPSEPRIYYTLARAYAKANRKDDAEQARETFARLNKMVEEAAQRGEQRGEAIEEREGRP